MGLGGDNRLYHSEELHPHIRPGRGASSIAGISTSVAGGSNIISLFALWGLSQLLMGIVYVVAYWRYRNLTPLAYVLILAEYSGRTVIGQLKPLTTSHIPPGAIGDYVLVPLALMMLALCFLRPSKRASEGT